MTKNAQITNYVKNVEYTFPLGGNKGLGLVLSVELLAGALLGYNTSIGKTSYDADNGLLVISIDPSKFISTSRYKNMVAETIKSLRASGGAGIYIPGDSRTKINSARKFLYIEKNILEQLIPGNDVKKGDILS